MSLLVVDGVHKDFLGRVALSGVSFTVAEGECVGVIGPNGAGKTTLANIITGFLAADRGAVRFRGARIDGLPPHEISLRGIRRTFQLTRNVPRMSVLENVLVASAAVGMPPARARRRAEELLEALTLASLAHEPAGHLSGGQQKLLELASCLVSDPALVILDEPFAAVHPSVKETIQQAIVRQKADGRTFLVISHDLGAFAGVASRLVAVGAGRLLADGAPEEVLAHPAVVEAYLGGEAWIR